MEVARLGTGGAPSKGVVEADCAKTLETLVNKNMNKESVVILRRINNDLMDVLLLYRFWVGWLFGGGY